MFWIVILSTGVVANVVFIVINLKYDNKYVAILNGFSAMICLVALLHAIWV